MSEHPGEFTLIDMYFKNKTMQRQDVVLGIGDDAALLRLPAQQLLVVAMDTLVCGVHFPVDTSAYDIAYKALAVNLSDLAAMGADPAWMTLALTMPESDSVWLDQFSTGLFDLAKQFNIQLVGGDTTRGPLAVTIQAHGFVPEQQAILRNGAKAGDKIYVSGTLGDAAFTLNKLSEIYSFTRAEQDFLLQRFNRPMPRVALGIKLRTIASSAIDISDGLIADLGHILHASHVGAEIQTEQLPLSNILRAKMNIDEAKKIALTGGDDYELCFTVAPQQEDALNHLLKNESLACTCIGEITKQEGIRLHDFAANLETGGYHHFN